MQGKPLNTNVRLEIDKSGFTAMEELEGQESKMERATVLEVGEEVTKVKEGDKVLFKDYNLDIIKVEGETFAICPEEDIKYVFR